MHASDDFIEVRIRIEAFGKPGFHNNGDFKFRETLLKGAYRTRQQQTDDFPPSSVL